MNIEFDYKPALMYIGAVIVNDINALLTTTGLILNIAYLGFQVYKQHKK